MAFEKGRGAEMPAAFRLAMTVVERRLRGGDIGPLLEFEGGALKVLYFIDFFDTLGEMPAVFCLLYCPFLLCCFPGGAINVNAL